jgi:hypothetical protein
MDDVKIDYRELATCARREVAMRQRVYPGRVAAGRMPQQVADYEIATMGVIAEVLDALACEAHGADVQPGDLVDAMRTDGPVIDPRSGKPYRAINRFSYERLTPAQQQLYEWKSFHPLTPNIGHFVLVGDVVAAEPDAGT